MKSIQNLDLIEREVLKIMIRIEFVCDICGNGSGKVICYLGSDIPYIECDDCKTVETIKIDEHRDA